MTKRKIPGGKYLPWYFDHEAKGRARKRVERPKRNILSIRHALTKMNLRWCEEISFWNEQHRGKQGDLSAGLQWLDFVVRKGKRPFVLILDDPMKRWKEYERKYLVTKQTELTRRGIPYVLLPARLSSQEYWILIQRFMKKKGI